MFGFLNNMGMGKAAEDFPTKKETKQEVLDTAKLMDLYIEKKIQQNRLREKGDDLERMDGGLEYEQGMEQFNKKGADGLTDLERADKEAAELQQKLNGQGIDVGTIRKLNERAVLKDMFQSTGVIK